MKPHKILLALTAVATLPALMSTIAFTARAATAGRNAPITGNRTPISSPPLWTHSGAWDYETGNLLLVDVLRSEVRRYDMNGRFIGGLSNDYAKAKGHKDPTIVQNTESGSVWVEYEDGYIVKFNKELEGISSLGLERAKNLLALFWWTPLDESNMLAFGDIQKGDQVTGAVIKIPLKNPAAFKVLQEVATNSPEHRFFLVGQPYLAAVKDAPYFLIMSEAPYIVKPDGRHLGLVRMTKAGREAVARPELPKRINIETTPVLFSKLQSSAAPAGLFGWNGGLYVLMRSPVDGGKTAWELQKLDPANGSILWSRAVDTTADFLVVVPGQQYWAFIEKGPVEAAGQQRVLSFLKVPAADIESQ